MAVSAASYSAGNRSYNGGSDAPQRGVLDPLPYVQRSMNQGKMTTPMPGGISAAPSGSGMQSQMQLLMRAAQNRMAQSEQSNGSGVNGTQRGYVPPGFHQTPQPQPPQQLQSRAGQFYHPGMSPTSTPTGQILPPRPAPTEPGLPGLTSPGAPAPVIHQPAPVAGGNTAPVGLYVPPGPTPTVGVPAATAPVSTAAPTSAPASSSPIPTQAPALQPYGDATYGVDATQVQSAYNTFLQQLQASQQAEALQYAQNQRNESLQEPIAYRNLLDNAAARGMASSSGYGYNVGQQAAAFQREIDDMNAAHTQALANFASQAQTQGQNYNSQLSALQAAAAARLAQQAGTLGIGTAQPVQQLPTNIGQVVPTAPVKSTKITNPSYGPTKGGIVKRPKRGG